MYANAAAATELLPSKKSLTVLHSSIEWRSLGFYRALVPL